jgi:hypothetical protein
MRKPFLLAAGAVLVLGLIGPPASADSEADSSDAAEIIARGPLSKDAAALARGKEIAQSLAGQGPASSLATAPTAPVTFAAFEGVKDENVAPSDSTGAIGPDRYIEHVNRMFAIYDRAGGLISSGTATAFTGVAANRNVFDPQIMWDPTTRRFYYAWDSVEPGFANSYIAFGWSKTSSPNGPADFCQYEWDPYPGSDFFPDYPKLGDMNRFMLIGVNVFDPPALGFVRSDALAFGKPAAGATCPAFGAIPRFVRADLRDEDGSQTFTPVPANKVDNPLPGGPDGVIIAADPYGVPRNFLTRFNVFVTAGAGVVVENPGKSIPIPAYFFPPNAPQAGTTKLLDTLDGRLTNAVFAPDPRLARLAVWTQHTVAGGAGSEARWYEVDPFGRTVLQSGVATDPALYVFNAAISPDRANNGATSSFGSNLVLGFNTSSSGEFPKIQMVSKVGAGAQSPFVLVQASLGFNQDFTCDTESVCRWGDYSAASPDPNPPPGPTGAVWLTNAFNDPSVTTADSDWRTWNWATTP